MQPSHAYSNKAQKYARYRWDYASEAIQDLVTITRLSPQATVADLGAGTGILTRHFAGKAARIYAVEPNAEMLGEARKRLDPNLFILLQASGERTGLPDHSVDLVSIAQAIHWMDPEPIRREILRILKPGGWLALLRNYGTDHAVSAALSQVTTPENGVMPAHPSPYPQMPHGYYFGGEHYQNRVYPFSFRQDWECFIGAMLSASYMPDEDHPRYPAFEAGVRQVFEQFSQDGLITVNGETELVIGQPRDGEG